MDCFGVSVSEGGSGEAHGATEPEHIPDDSDDRESARDAEVVINLKGNGW